MRISQLFKPYFCLVLILVQLSCGAESTEEHVKDFKFFITNNRFSRDLTIEVEKIFSRINKETGLQRFQLVDSAEQANSYINLVNVSRYFGNHSIGAGGPIYSISREKGPFNIELPTTKTVVYHGMDIDIDRKWFVRNIIKNKPYSFIDPPNGNRAGTNQNLTNNDHNIGAKSSYNQKVFETLILHEIGHGLGFSHVSNESDVMYESVGDGKDLQNFFQRVKETLTSNYY